MADPTYSFRAGQETFLISPSVSIRNSAALSLFRTWKTMNMTDRKTVTAHETPMSTIQALVSRRNLAAFDSGVAAGAGSGLVCFSSIVFSGIHDPLKGGRAGETRTRNPRFWRPIVYQLTYRPTAP